MKSYAGMKKVGTSTTAGRATKTTAKGKRSRRTMPPTTKSSGSTMKRKTMKRGK